MKRKKGGEAVKVALINPDKDKKGKKRRRKKSVSVSVLAKLNPALPDVIANPEEYTVKISKKRRRRKAKRNPDIVKTLTDKNTLIGAGIGFAASRFLIPRIAPNIPFVKDNPQFWSFITPATGGVMYLIGKGKMKNIGLGVAVGGLADMLIQRFTGGNPTPQALPSGVSGLENDEQITEAVFPPPPDFDEPLTPEEEAEIQELANELGVSTDEELGFLRWLWRRARRGINKAVNIGKIAPAWTPVGAAARVGERFIKPEEEKSQFTLGIKPRLNLKGLKGIRLKGTINLQVV